MIIHELKKEDALTNTEKSIAKYLLDKENNINHLTSSELGRLTFTSQAAVTRLCKKLGYSNFREFLSRLIIERKEYFSFSAINEEHPEEYLASFEDIQGVISSLYMKSMMRTNAKLDKNVMTRLVNYILSAQNIDIYGQGIAETTAKQLVYKLQSLGLPCSYQMHLIDKYVENMKNPKRHVSIIFCVEPSRITIQGLVSKMKDKGIYTIAIVGHANDPIIQYVNDALYFDISSFTDVEYLTATFSAEYVSNIIYSTIVYRKVLVNNEDNL